MIEYVCINLCRIGGCLVQASRVVRACDVVSVDVRSCVYSTTGSSSSVKSRDKMPRRQSQLIGDLLLSPDKQPILIDQELVMRIH